MSPATVSDVPSRVNPNSSAAASPSVPAIAVGMLAIAFGLLAWNYAELFPQLIHVWNIDPNYSHGFVVPVVSLVFARIAWQSIGPPLSISVSRREVVRGAIKIVLGLIFHLFGWLLHHHLLDVVSLIFILRGMLLILGGDRVDREYGFAPLFLIFMAPLPLAWYQPIALMLQHVVSTVSTPLLELLGTPVFREGNMMHLPGYVMEVGAACGGLRQLTAMLAVSVAIGRMWKLSWPTYTALVVLSVPIAVISNCLRVVGTGVILTTLGSEWADGFYHTCEGLLLVGVATGLVIGTASLLYQFDRRKSDKPADNDQTVVQKSPSANTATLSQSARLMGMGAIVAVGVGSMLATKSYVRSVPDADVAKLQAPLTEFPLKIADWTGRDIEIPDDTIAFADEHVYRRYTHGPTGQKVTLWLGYSQFGLDRNHHPQVCMAVAGQAEIEQDRIPIPLPGHDGPVQRFRFGNLGSRQWIYYWHYTFNVERSLATGTLRRVYQRLHTLVPSVTVEVFAPSESDDDSTVRAFAAQVDSHLQRHVAGKARRGSVRKPIAILDGPAPDVL